MTQRFRTSAPSRSASNRRSLSLGSPSNVTHFGFGFDTTEQEDWEEMTSFEFSEMGFGPSSNFAV